MAKGIAVAIGLNAVDPGHYSGWSGELSACESDAKDMAAIAREKGFSVTTFLTRDATRKRVVDAISSAAASLKSGDILLLSYSGHGGQLPDLNGDEPDGLDETWCLFDGQLVDDELYALWGKFTKGTRVLVFSDSCHSGTVVKIAYWAARGEADASGRSTHGISHADVSVRYRAMPHSVGLRTYQDHKDMYDPILKNTKLRDAQAKVQASVLLISGCQDNQLSADGPFNGLFTATLLRVWNGGKFKGNYRQFHKAIVRNMPPDQTPNYFLAGTPDTGYESQEPFTIG